MTSELQFFSAIVYRFTQILLCRYRLPRSVDGALTVNRLGSIKDNLPVEPEVKPEATRVIAAPLLTVLSEPPTPSSPPPIPVNPPYLHPPYLQVVAREANLGCGRLGLPGGRLDRDEGSSDQTDVGIVIVALDSGVGGGSMRLRLTEEHVQPPLVSMASSRDRDTEAAMPHAHEWGADTGRAAIWQGGVHLAVKHTFRILAGILALAGISIIVWLFREIFEKEFRRGVSFFLGRVWKRGAMLTRSAKDDWELVPSHHTRDSQQYYDKQNVAPDVQMQNVCDKPDHEPDREGHRHTSWEHACDEHRPSDPWAHGGGGNEFEDVEELPKILYMNENTRRRADRASRNKIAQLHELCAQMGVRAVAMEPSLASVRIFHDVLRHAASEAGRESD